MERIEPSAKLDSAQFNLLQEILERFELDCARGGTRSIREYLPASNGPLREAVLEELVRTDLEMRWRQRKGVLLEHYFAEFPELKNQPSLMQLVEDEYRLRQRYGDKPRVADVQARFPQLSDQLAALTEEGRSAPLQKASTRPATDTPKPKAKSEPPAPALDDSSQILPTQASQFKKVRRIGKGAFGEVWEAIGPGGVPVAVKRIFGAVSASAVRRERASLDLICSGKLRHPFLLQVFGWWIEEERLHIAMELADGTVEDSLKNARAQGRAGMEVGELKQIFLDAADSLDFLNLEKNILHRDVKPANMLLMARRLKLCDFGLARMTENLMLAAGRTRGAGTPVFIAPEIVIGYQSPYSDQYSLAASYYLLRTGKPIFSGKVEAIRDQHVNATPQLEDDVLSAAEKTVLLKALSKAPEQRFPSSTEFANEMFAGVAQSLRKSGPVKLQSDWHKAVEVQKTEMVAESRSPEAPHLAAALEAQANQAKADARPAAATVLKSAAVPAPPLESRHKELQTSLPDIDTLPPDGGINIKDLAKKRDLAKPPTRTAAKGQAMDLPTMPISAEMLGVPVPKPSLRMNDKPGIVPIDSGHSTPAPAVAAPAGPEKTVPIKHPFEQGKKTPKKKEEPKPAKKKSDSGGSIKPLKVARGTALERLQQQIQQDQKWKDERQSEQAVAMQKLFVIATVAAVMLFLVLIVAFAF